jgi:hypothetical protein
MAGMIAAFQARRNLPFQNQAFVKTEHLSRFGLALRHAI